MRGPEWDSAPRSFQEAPRARNLVFYEEKAPSKIECCKFAGSPKSPEPRVLRGKMRFLTRTREIPKRPQEPETSYFTKENGPPKINLCLRVNGKRVSLEELWKKAEV